MQTPRELREGSRANKAIENLQESLGDLMEDAEQIEGRLQALWTGDTNMDPLDIYTEYRELQADWKRVEKAWARFGSHTRNMEMLRRESDEDENSALGESRRTPERR